MKTRFPLLALCGFAAVTQAAFGVQTTSSPPAAATQTAPALAGGLNEVVRLAKSGVDESVIIAFVQNAPIAYNPTADDVLKLRDAGISPQVITAILQHGGELRAQAARAISQANNSGQPAPVAPQSSATYSTPSDNSGPVVYANPYATDSYAAPASYNYYNNYYPGYSYPYYSSDDSYYPYYSYRYPYYYPYYYPFYAGFIWGSSFNHNHSGHSGGIHAHGSANVNNFNQFNQSSGTVNGTHMTHRQMTANNFNNAQINTARVSVNGNMNFVRVPTQFTPQTVNTGARFNSMNVRASGMGMRSGSMGGMNMRSGSMGGGSMGGMRASGGFHGGHR